MLTQEAEAGLTNDFFSHIDFSGGALAAVSGGSDSTALLLLLKQHLDRAAPATRLVAATVEHGLRDGSAAEAKAVGALCANLGVPHIVLPWRGAKPKAGLPAAAREARYRLLAQAARDANAGMVLTGHTADDQGETVLMRRARASAGARAVRGLAGMAPATLHDWQTWIVRPLLGARRSGLRDMLRARGVGWAEDPTNADEAFERPRIRAMLAGAGGEAMLAEALALADKAARERMDMGRRAARLVDAHAALVSPGLARLDRDLFAGPDRQAAVYVLRILLAAIGGLPRLPDEARGAALFERLSGGPFRATLSRTAVDARRSGVFLHRESRGLPEISAPVDGMVWDGRFRIACEAGAAQMSIAPRGLANLAEMPPSDAPAPLVRAALAGQPALWRGGERLDSAAEGTGSVMVRPAVAPWAHFLPCFDLAPAATVARLFGAPDIAALPFPGHIAGGPWSNA